MIPLPYCQPNIGHAKLLVFRRKRGQKHWKILTFHLLPDPINLTQLRGKLMAATLRLETETGHSTPRPASRYVTKRQSNHVASVSRTQEIYFKQKEVSPAGDMF